MSLLTKIVKLRASTSWHVTALYSSLRHLGVYNGIRYYKVSCACRKNPAIIEDWASSCQAEAMNTEDPAMKSAFKAWAKLLRANLKTHEDKNNLGK